MIPIYKPFINRYIESANTSLKDGWISNHGKYIKLSSDLLKKFLNVDYCILMNSGTAATHCLFLSLKYKYPNIKKIYVPNNVFIASYNSVLMEYSKDMIEVMKIDKNTFNIDTSEDYIKTLSKNSAVLIVHNLGYIVNVPRLKNIRPDLVFLEDNCEGFTGKYNNKFSGSESLCSSLSFYANKTITSGQGGAFLTNDMDLYNYITKVHNHGMTKEKYIHDILAYNYKMTNISAALLYEQLKDINYILKIKNNIFVYYDNLLLKLFQNNKIIKLKDEENTINAKWMYCIIIPNVKYKNIEKYMNNNNIETRPFFYDISKHKHLKNIRNIYPKLVNVESGIMLPSYPELKKQEQIFITDCLIKYLNTL